MGNEIKEVNKKTPIKYYIILQLILLQLSFGGILSKIAAKKEFMSLGFCLCYGLMILNLGIYAILWQQIIKKISLTTAFCNKAVSIIWGMIWGALLFQEVITWNMILGAVVVMVGVVLVVSDDR